MNSIGIHVYVCFILQRYEELDADRSGGVYSFPITAALIISWVLMCLI